DHFSQMAMTARVLWYFLMVRVRYEEGIDLFERATSRLRTLPASEARNLALGELLHNLGFFMTSIGWPAKRQRLAEESLAVLQEYQAAEMMVRVYITLCRSEWLLGEYDQMKLDAQRGIATAQQVDDPWHKGLCLFLLGAAQVYLGKYEEASHAGE